MFILRAHIQSINKTEAKLVITHSATEIKNYITVYACRIPTIKSIFSEYLILFQYTLFSKIASFTFSYFETFLYFTEFFCDQINFSSLIHLYSGDPAVHTSTVHNSIRTRKLSHQPHRRLYTASQISHTVIKQCTQCHVLKEYVPHYILPYAWALRYPCWGNRLPPDCQRWLGESRAPDRVLLSALPT